ncbi:MAG: hypothetical protein ACI9PZ_002820, partial [Parvicella sp.]
ATRLAMVNILSGMWLEHHLQPLPIFRVNELKSPRAVTLRIL